ncbi:Hypothetical protein Cp262_2226 [Corynebacterium pseudotuberculosis]|nr:Hypothetical protein Cp262_2226 [Corynebacterium pseudotuberculosis]
MQTGLMPMAGGLRRACGNVEAFCYMSDAYEGPLSPDVKENIVFKAIFFLLVTLLTRVWKVKLSPHPLH